MHRCVKSMNMLWKETRLEISVCLESNPFDNVTFVSHITLSLHTVPLLQAKIITN